ncbi:hypothetical protein BJV82DRAFT_599537 [Fennellomyces sp. T-0311]|nr:hypothetical protein BJV82DRAFT_599537 [Fennellomyces sp. T-0311]
MLRDDASIEFHIDPAFTGIMRGFADDESEGCTLTGTCVVRVHRPMKVRRLVVWFEGRTKVNLRGTGAMGISSTELMEARSLYYKSLQHVGGDGHLQPLDVGTYTYPFSFELPATLPASFRSKYGVIRYRLQCAIFRPTFSSDIHSCREVTLRRSLMGDHLTSATAADMMDTVSGVNHAEQIHYSATATSMTYREGGLVKLNLNVHLGRPETQSVRSVTCGLREIARYRTTGERSLTCQSSTKTDEVYPLGWSTFYPSRSPDYCAADPHDYNAVFRLCPRVNADNETRLLDVKHAVIVNIMVEERHEDKKLTPQQIEHAFSTAAAATSNTAPTPPASQPATPPVLSRTSSSSSISSIFSLRQSGSKSNASSRRSSISGITPSTPSRRDQPHLTLCTLEIPVLVTSREHIWDGAMPSPPAYNTAEAPPSYFQTLEQLPAVPIYPEAQAAS